MKSLPWIIYLTAAANAKPLVQLNVQLVEVREFLEIDFFCQILAGFYQL